MSPPGTGTDTGGGTGSSAAAAADGTLHGDGGFRAAVAPDGRRHLLLRGRCGVHGVEEGDDVAVLREGGEDALRELHRVEQLDVDEVVELRERLLLRREVRAQLAQRVGGVERVPAALEEGRCGNGGACRSGTATCSCCGGESAGMSFDGASGGTEASWLSAGVSDSMHVPVWPSGMQAMRTGLHTSYDVQCMRFMHGYSHAREWSTGVWGPYRGQGGGGP